MAGAMRGVVDVREWRNVVGGIERIKG